MFVGRMLLLTVVMVAGSVWIGSLVSLAVVSSVARRDLDARSSVVLFRGVGRSYQYLGTGSLLVTVAASLVLAWPVSEVDGRLGALFLLSAVLLAVTVAGMVQARRMTVRRRTALERPTDASAALAVRRGAVAATGLRALIGAVTLAMVLTGAHLLAW